MAPKGGLDATLASGPTYFDPPLHFTPTLGGLNPLGAVAHTQMAKKGQKTPKGPKMAQNDQKWPQRGGLDATWALGTHQF